MNGSGSDVVSYNARLQSNQRGGRVANLNGQFLETSFLDDVADTRVSGVEGGTRFRRDVNGRRKLTEPKFNVVLEN